MRLAPGTPAQRWDTRELETKCVWRKASPRWWIAYNIDQRLMRVVLKPHTIYRPLTWHCSYHSLFFSLAAFCISSWEISHSSNDGSSKCHPCTVKRVNSRAINNIYNYLHPRWRHCCFVAPGFEWYWPFEYYCDGVAGHGLDSQRPLLCCHVINIHFNQYYLLRSHFVLVKNNNLLHHDSNSSCL